MNREILLYGIPPGETERYTEALLATTCKTAADVERVKTVAGNAGYHGFRIAYFDGLPPDFTKVLKA